MPHELIDPDPCELTGHVYSGPGPCGRCGELQKEYPPKPALDFDYLNRKDPGAVERATSPSCFYREKAAGRLG